MLSHFQIKKQNYFTQYLFRNLRQKLDNKTIHAIANSLETILFSIEDELLNANESNFNGINDRAWQLRLTKLITQLDRLKLEINMSKDLFSELLTTLQQFLNSVDYSIYGKSQKRSFLDFSLVTHTPGFKRFYYDFSQYVNLYKETSYFNSAKNMLSSVANVLQQALTYTNEHPYQALSLIFVFNALVVSSKKFEEDKSLEAYYPFNTNALDATGHNNDGIVYGARLTSDRFDKANSAYYFDTTSYILGKALTYPRGDRTIALWFKPEYYPVETGYDRAGSLFGHSGNNNDISANFEIAINQGAICSQPKVPNNYIAWGWGDTNSGLYCYENLYGTPFVWGHITVTSSYHSGLSIYINGLQICNKMFSFQTEGYITDFSIGTIVLNGKEHNDVCTYNFKGSIDDVMVFSRSLSASEVKALYDEQNTVPEPQPEKKDGKSLSKTEVGLIGGGVGAAVGLMAAGFAVLFFKCRDKRKQLIIDPVIKPDEESSLIRRPKKKGEGRSLFQSYGTTSKQNNEMKKQKGNQDTKISNDSTDAIVTLKDNAKVQREVDSQSEGLSVLNKVC